MKKLLQSLFVLLFIAGSALAQNRTITGTVTAQEDKLALPGVSVKIKGTSTGTTTAANGKYSIVAQNGSVLVFSYIGYKTQEITVGSSNTINPSLESDANQLQEVVVTGVYGLKQTARSTSYSAQVVQSEQLNTVRQTDINNALAGKAVGMQVRSQSAAALGRPTEVRLRGASGFGEGAGAIYVVDGTILTDASDISLDDVENVSVLQGAAASAQFGSQGANGAIVITTKKGKKADGLGISLNLGATFENAYILPNYQNTYAGGSSSSLMQYNYKAGDPVEWRDLDGKYYHDYSDDSSWGPKMVGQEYIPWYAWYPGTQYTGKTASLTPQPNNARDYFNTGVALNNGFTISKGGEDFNIRFGYTNQNVQGLIPNSDQNKNIFNINTSYDITKKLNISANINYVNNRLRGEIDDAYSNQSTGSFSQWFHRNLDMGIMEELRGLRTDEGIYASWNHANPNAYDASNPKAFYGANYWYNFYTYYDLNNKVNQRDRLFGNIALTYKITDDLKVVGTYRKQQNTNWLETRYSSQLNNSGIQTSGNNELVKGFYGTSNSYSNRENLEFLVNYNKKIKDFSIDANVGTDFYSYKAKGLSAQTVNGLSVDDLYTIGNSVDQPSITNTRIDEKYRTIFARATFGYKNFLFVDGTLRNDYYSTLPINNNSISSKSIGASFVFTDLLSDSFKGSWLSFGKIRASWGEIPKALGNTNETFGAYRYPGGLYSVNQYKWNGNILMSTPDQFVDPAIRGSVVTQREIGLDLRFFNNKLTFEGTYYEGDEKDFPYTLSVNGASGYSSILTNIGLISKKGIDLKIGGTPVNTPNLRWDVNATWGRLLSNKIEEISTKYGVNRINVDGVWGTTMPYMIHQEGMQWGQIYGNGIKRNEEGIPYVTSSGAYVNDPNVYFGSVLPKFTGGLQNSFTVLKDFTLNVNIDYQYGGKFVSLSNMFGSYSGLTARTAALNDKGNPVRDAVADGGGVKVTGVSNTTGEPVEYYVGAQAYFQGLHNNKTYDDYIYDLSFVKLRELSLGYRIPVNKLGISKYVKNATFSVVGRNLWLMYAKTKDFDPSEVSALRGETGQLPGTRGFGFNLKIGF